MIALLGVVWLDARAQFGTVHGVVVQGATEAPLQSANVWLESESGTRGTATDAEGQFTLTGIGPGTHVLVVTHVGYHQWTDTLDVAFGEEIRMLVPLEESAEELDELVVDTEDDRSTTSRGAAHIQVRPAALQRVPMPDVSADLAAYLLTRPGVVAPGDRGGQLFIRGGTPAQNLVLLDGMPIFQPFHIVGFYSVFPSDIVAEADVYAGGFGAEYGGRISSVIDVSTRSGSKRGVRGAASIAPFLASVRAEIPLATDEVSLVASVRESVVERLPSEILGERLPYRFGDRFLKLHAFLSRTSSFSATALHSFDEGNVAGIGGRTSTWENTAVGGRYFYLPQDFPATAELAVFGTRYESSYVPGGGERRFSNAETFNLKLRFAYLLGALQLRFGIEGATNWLDYDLGHPHTPERQSVTEGGFFFVTDWSGSHFEIEPGVRIQGFSNQVGTTVEPRLRLAWRPRGSRGRQTFSAAWGLYRQQMLGLNNQRDVTDAFTAWAVSPQHEPLPSSTHYIVGWERRLLAFLQISAEAYYRDVRNVLFPFLEDEFGSAARLDRVDGSARGLDIGLELIRPGVYVYAGYGLSAVEYHRPRSDNDRSVADAFAPPHDRRHNFNLQAQLSLGHYRLSLRWHYGSGVPFTPIQGYYYESSPSHPRDDAFLTQPGTVRAVFAEPYSRRLPAYHRLDLSAERRISFDGWQLIVQAGMINVYDRANIFSYDILENRRVDQLPLIPSLGVRVEINE